MAGYHALLLSQSAEGLLLAGRALLDRALEQLQLFAEPRWPPLLVVLRVQCVGLMVREGSDARRCGCRKVALFGASDVGLLQGLWCMQGACVFRVPLPSEGGTQDGQGQIMAVALRRTSLNPFKVLPLLSEADGAW